ncbi:hypothetical protein LTR70_007652 [Exophiala xenobiotica]|uniref:Uncharacterized protein n=1 Tax=Lithohypha guttulata TaxID=1690604 RepID=A0ABR0K1U9_9EURO|nr:hypothetical protein LTR24_007921 [Lithohypha guttulata]KAK5313348.1 hypothetical protein LTR70_007652 [Exophiala xenobiotica]
MDSDREDSEDGDVSTTGRLVTNPTNVPPVPSQHASVTPEAIASYLSELEHMEYHVVQAQHRQQERRIRKDSRIARERRVQDQSFQRLMDTRGHRDSRVAQRRQREDDAFHHCYRVMDDLENRLRRHWKRLRRGLHLDGTTTSISTEATPHPARAPIKLSRAATTPGQAESTALHRTLCSTPPLLQASLRHRMHGHAEHAASAPRPHSSTIAINDSDTAHHAAVAGLIALSRHTTTSAAPPTWSNRKPTRSPTGFGW